MTMPTQNPTGEPSKAVHPLDVALRDATELRGWWHGYHGEPGLIRVSPFQADYIRGYQDGWRYARHN